MEGGVAYHFSVSLPPGVRLVSPGLVFILRERGFVFPLQLNSPFFCTVSGSDAENHRAAAAAAPAGDSGVAEPQGLAGEGSGRPPRPEVRL